MLRQKESVVPNRSPACVPLLLRLDVKTLVIFRALQLGDMLCAIPAFRALRTALPDARITLVSLPWAAQFTARFHDYIDDFIAFPGHAGLPEQPLQEEQRIPEFYRTVRARQFDLALQIHGNGRISNRIVADFGAKAMAGYVMSGKTTTATGCFFTYPETGAEPLRLLRLVEFLGAPATTLDLEFPLTEPDRRELRQSGLGAGLVDGRYICIHPGARLPDKRWPPERFAEVGDRLTEQYQMPIVLTGSGQEVGLAQAVAQRMQNPAINAAAPLSIGAMAALLSRARLLICNDTGVSHIAAGLMLPSVVIFSKSDRQRWAPLDQKLHRSIWDPDGNRAAAVLESARMLLAQADSRRQFD